MFSSQTTGIEDHVREQIASYFHSARVGIERLSLFAPPSLKNLQALLYGVSLFSATLICALKVS